MVAVPDIVAVVRECRLWMYGKGVRAGRVEVLVIVARSLRYISSSTGGRSLVIYSSSLPRVWLPADVDGTRCPNQGHTMI